MTNNMVTLENTQAQIDEATKTIFEAQKKLEKKVNLTDHKAALEAVRPEDYTDKSWAAYEKVVAENRVSEDNSQTEVDKATKKIKDAQRKLVRTFDFTDYNALLERVNEDDYVAVTWSVYEDILAANQVSENDTQSDVEKAIKKIEKAQAKLVKKADLSYYNALLAAVDKDDYTTDSWKTYQQVVRSVTVNEMSKEEVIDKAVLKIMEAQLDLVPVGDLIYYMAAINKKSRTDYTTASWETYQKAVEANAVIPTDGQEAIDEATEKIEAAQKKLVGVGDMTEYNKVLANVNKDPYTSDSWEKYQKVLDSNYTRGGWEQKAIDAAIVKIEAAQRKLVEKGNLDEYKNVLAAVDPKDYTTASWEKYAKVLDSNHMDPDTSQTQIDKAVSNIKRAQSKLDIAGNLAEYNKVLSFNLSREADDDGPIVMKSIDYTPSSWEGYEKVLDKNFMDRDKSQAQIDKAVLNIERAQSKLILRADPSVYDEYKDLLEKNWVKRDTYTTASWNKYQEVVDKNVMTPENSEAEINGAILKIERAQQNLQKKSGTSEYDDVYHKYDGREKFFTTAGLEAYQKVLDNKSNILTAEDSEAAIKAAIKRIETAQGKLELSRVPGILETYKTIIEECEKKRRDYTDESWREYQLVVSKNYVNKDSSEAEINDAIGKVTEAQLNLVRSINTKAFFSAIALYQENKLQNGKYAGHVSPDSWQAYADSVNKYVSFDKNGAWDPYGPKEHDITYDSSQVMINKAVETIEAKKAAFVYNFAEEFAAYDQAIKLEPGKTADDYTTSSYSYFEGRKRENEILDDDRIKLDKADIIKRTANIVAAKEVLTPRANPSTVAKFDYEIDQYNQKNTHDRDWDAKMGQLVIWYTKSTWDAYSTQYKKYSIDPNTRLDPTNNTDDQYNTAYAALKDAREALKITAKHAAFDLNEWASGLRLNSVSTGMNVLNVAKTYVKDDNFELSIPEGIDERVSSTGVISGKSGDKVNIRFELKEKEDAGNSWGETYYNILISN